MQRRKLFQTAGLALSASLGASVSSTQAADPAAAPIPADPEKIRGYPVLMNPTGDSLSVVWVARGPCLGSVEYGPAPDKLIHKVMSSDHQGYAVLGNIHKVRLKDLPAGEPVFYRTLTHKAERPLKVSDESAVYRFSLPKADAEEIRFAQFSDTHENKIVADRLLARVAELQPDFFIWNGDVVDWVSSEDRILNAVLLPVDRPFASTIPMVFSRGNHDCTGNFPQEYAKYIGSPDDRFYYMFRMGPVAFSVLDSERGDVDEHLPARYYFDPYRPVQTAWSAREFKRPDIASAPVKIAIFHIPLWSRRRDFPDLRMREGHLKILEENKVNLCMCGHMHAYEYLKPGDTAAHPTFDPDAPTVSLHQIISGGPTESSALVIRGTATKDKITLVTEDLDKKVIDTVVIPC